MAATFFGIIVTDALLAYNYEHSTSPMLFMSLRRIMHHLLSSIILMVTSLNNHREDDSQVNQSLSHHQILWIRLFPMHPLRSLGLLPAYQSKKGSKDQKKVHVANVLFAQLTGKGTMHITTVRHVRIFLRVP